MAMRKRVERLEMAIKPPGETTIVVRYGDDDIEAEPKIKEHLDAGGDEDTLVILNVVYDNPHIDADGQ
jgi:hypothetical protein